MIDGIDPRGRFQWPTTMPRHAEPLYLVTIDKNPDGTAWVSATLDDSLADGIWHVRSHFEDTDDSAQPDAAPERERRPEQRHAPRHWKLFPTG